MRRGAGWMMPAETAGEGGRAIGELTREMTREKLCGLCGFSNVVLLILFDLLGHVFSEQIPIRAVILS
jgi:hypothetical protein